MIYLFMLFMLCCGYYTVTYGMSLWKDDNNKLGAIAVIAFAVVGTVLPSLVLYIKT